MRSLNSAPENDLSFPSSRHSVRLLLDTTLRHKKEHSFNSLEPFEFVGISQQKMKQHMCNLNPPWCITTVHTNESALPLNYLIGFSGLTNTNPKMSIFPNGFLVSTVLLSQGSSVTIVSREWTVRQIQWAFWRVTRRVLWSTQLHVH
jgi:hypothetical protein